MNSIRYYLMAFCMLAITTKAYTQDLFALTRNGGNANKGTIIKYNATNNTLGAVYNFSAPDAQGAIDPELKAYNGKLYGVSRNGGAYDNGVIFEWDPATNVYTKKHDFNLASTTNGAYPEGGLTLVGTKFYGVTTQAAGVNAHGCIFEWDPATNVFTKKYTMTLANGREPVSTLLLIGTKLYGMARLGGNFSGGSIFEWDTSTNIFTRHQSFSQGDYPVGSLVHIGGTKFYGVTR